MHKEKIFKKFFYPWYFSSNIGQNIPKKNIGQNNKILRSKYRSK